MGKRRPNQRERAINIDGFAPPPLPKSEPLPPGIDFQLTTEVFTTRHSKVTKTVTRRGKWLYIETVRRTRSKHTREDSRSKSRERATIRFTEIVDAFVVEEDPDMNAPWKEHDGYEHIEIDYSEFVAAASETADIAKLYAGWRRRRGNVDGILAIDLDLGNPNCRENYEAIYEYARHRGASKQVAREIQACWRRRYIDQIVDWRKNGWFWWQVYGKFKNLQESSGGIDDQDYAEKEVVPELASYIAHELEKQGYLIDYGDLEERQKQACREYKLKTLRENVNLQNWTG
jgi:hypothetical protein